MDKRNFILMLSLMALLVICIGMMSAALLMHERTFRQVSGYIAIGCIVITLVGVGIVIYSEKHNKDE